MVSFEATKSTLQDTLDSLGVILDEAVLVFEADGVTANGTDPAEVAMVDLSLSTDAFESYEADQTRAGFNLSRFSDIVGMAPTSGVLSVDEADTGRVTVSTTGLEYTMALIDPESIRAGQEIPDAEWDAELTIDAATFTRGIDACAMVSDHLRLQVVDGDFCISATGDTDEVTLNAAEEDDAEVEFDGSPDACQAMFSLDYLKSVAKAIPNSADVSVSLRDGFPAVLSFEIADGDGMVTYAVAPRIES